MTSPPATADAVVIGAGPNGLVAANLLADEGWDVVVLEAANEPGGAVKTAEVTAPGFRNDLFSACYPMAVASPVMQRLQLEDHGLRWCHAPLVVAHPTPAGAAVVSRDAEATAAGLERFGRGDGAAWLALVDRWDRVGDPFLDALFTPFPPINAGAELVLRAPPSDLRWLTRLALLPVRRLVDEELASEQSALLLAGNALHADFTPESAGSGLFGFFMAMLAQQVGFPAPEGGAQELTAALTRRLETRGGKLRCGQRVTQVIVEQGRAIGVETAAGDVVRAARAVLADTIVTKLFGDLVPRDHLPLRWRDGLRRFDPGPATVKVDWALRGPVPWRDESLHGAGVVHVASSMDELSRGALQLASGWIPRDPFLLVGLMSTIDPTRSPSGTESAWAYAHVPQRPRGDAGSDGLTGRWDERETECFADRIEQRIEDLAPGFRDLVAGRHVMGPHDLEARDPNLVGGAVGGGTAQLHQTAVLRPVPGLGRSETPVRGLYLASASAHPGGGVHGAPGANAARAALAHHRLRGPFTAALARRLGIRR